MVEDLHLIRVAGETKDDPLIPWDKMKGELLSATGRDFYN
jgi:hypothetical protein